jgi:hypothetical protein
VVVEYLPEMTLSADIIGPAGVPDALSASFQP